VAETTVRGTAAAAAKTLIGKVDSLVTDSAHLNVDLEDVLKLVRERHALLKRSNQS
jgi:hypothetical protein